MATDVETPVMDNIITSNTAKINIKYVLSVLACSEFPVTECHKGE